MTVLRELVAKLGFQVDDAGFKKATAAVEGVKASVQVADARLRDAGGRFMKSGSAAAAAASQYRDVAGRLREANGRFVGTGAAAAGAAGGVARTGKSFEDLLGPLGKYLSIAAIGFGVKKMVQWASDANETANVLQEVFGAEGQKRVQDWAQTMGDTMGRSQFQLREFAGGLGAMLEPMVGNSAAAEEMSKQIAGLAVDLGSFFNTSDEEALAALKSGLAGEAEPLKRFGVVLQDATLQEYAHAQGITKKTQSMSVAEKTQLRYNFILDHTTKAHGDAARTLDGFANSSKATEARVRELGTRIGVALLPAGKQMLFWAQSAIGWFLKFTQGNKSLEIGLGVLAAAFVAFKAQAAAAWLAAFAPLAVPLAALAFLTLLIDDINALFSGGKSVIGDWLDEAYGIGTAQALVDDVNTGLAVMKESWQSATEAVSEFMANLPDLVGMWVLLTGAGEDFGVSVSDAIEGVFDWVSNLDEKVYGLIQRFASLVGIKLPSAQESAPSTARTGRGLGAGIIDNAQANGREREERIRKESAARAATQRELDARQYAGGQGTDAGLREFGVAQVAARSVSAAVAPAAVAGGTQTTVHNGPISIHVGAGVGAAEAARAARHAASAERRRTAEAMKRGG